MNFGVGYKMPLTPDEQARVDSFLNAVELARADEIIHFALNQMYPIPTEAVINALNSSGGLRFSPILACMARAELMAERYEGSIDERNQDDLALKYIKLLVACGADINLSGEASFPLLWASKRGWNRCVQYLLEQGADPNQSMASLPETGHSAAKRTPLMAACANRQWETALLLMKNSKTNTDLTDAEGYTAVQLAKKAVEDLARSSGALGAGDTISFAHDLTLDKFLEQRAPKSSKATFILGAGASAAAAEEEATLEASPIPPSARQNDAVLRVLGFTCRLALDPDITTEDRISYRYINEDIIIPKEARNEESLKLILDNILNRNDKGAAFANPTFISILAQYTKLPTEPKYSRSCTDLIDKILDKLSPRHYESFDQDPIPRLKDTLRQIKEFTVTASPDPVSAAVPAPVIATEGEFLSIIKDPQLAEDADKIIKFLRVNPTYINKLYGKYTPLTAVIALSDVDGDPGKEKRCFDRVEALLNMGADVNQAALNGTPLTFAANRGFTPLVTRLLDIGANIDGYVEIPAEGTRSVGRETALIKACKKGHWDTAILLVKRKANLTIKNDKNITALEMAIAYLDEHTFSDPSKLVPLREFIKAVQHAFIVSTGRDFAAPAPALAPVAPVFASTSAAVPVEHAATARGFFGAAGKQQPKATKLSKQEQELFGKLMAYMVDRTADRREYFSVYKWFRGCDSRTIKLNAAQQLLTAISNQDPTLLNILGKLEKRALNDSRLGKIYAEYLQLQSSKQAPSASF